MKTASPSPAVLPTAVPRPGLQVGGLEKLSLVDWPGELSAVVFCQGCAWNCRYCHNPHLIPFAHRTDIAWEGVLAWLEKRRGLLDAVVFSGGEATYQVALPAALKEVRRLGFKTGLHTGGPYPKRMAEVLPLLDWVGFDYKAPFDRYAPITGIDQGRCAQESFGMLLASGVAYEVRTTWHPSLLSGNDLEEMAQTLEEAGCREWVVQRFRPDGCVDEALCAVPTGQPPPALLRPRALKITVR
ncbi:MAG TPA: anaerobic ribonucleoside-triphosphate reductase activating protein [Chthoniobacteraceae bacterium]|nr:anaerobic ribonucleoside-triphosphate reductase activating protein [Chthoniobacteraceae bacterium]